MLQQNGLTAAHADPVAPIIFGVTLILAAALIGRYGARRLGQPSVLGELVIGVLLGNFLVFGMLPRGEVGLVFASIGESLGVIDASMFSAVVVMVMVTSLATPPLMKRVMERAAGSAEPEGQERPCK